MIRFRTCDNVTATTEPCAGRRSRVLGGEYLLQVFDFDRRGYGKYAVFVETSIGNQDQ